MRCNFHHTFPLASKCCSHYRVLASSSFKLKSVSICRALLRSPAITSASTSSSFRVDASSPSLGRITCISVDHQCGSACLAPSPYLPLRSLRPRGHPADQTARRARQTDDAIVEVGVSERAARDGGIAEVGDELQLRGSTLPVVQFTSQHS